MKLISFAIPVYRNEKAISLTYQKIRTLFESIGAEYDFEIVFTDDGSDDGSLAEIMALRERDKRVKFVSFTRNFGQMSAILASFQHVTGDACINVSADLQDPVELVAQMIASWHSGNKVVVCYRTDRKEGLSRKIVSRAAYALIRLAYPQIPPGGFDFFLIDRVVLDSFNALSVRNRFLQGDILWYGYPTSYIPYVRQQRPIGKSQYNFGKRLKNFLDALLDSSYLPIRAISFLGISISLLGFIYMLTVFYSYFWGKMPFSGWAPLMVIQLIMFGTLMLMIGVIGEYVWRIYDELKGKPNFVIKSRGVDDGD